VGYVSSYSNTTGTNLVSVGRYSLYGNTTGTNNTAIGHGSSEANTTGSANTALGSQSLYSNTTASNNTAVGYQALYSNTTAPGNTAIGYQAGDAITTGEYNTLLGFGAGGALTTGTLNTFVGVGFTSPSGALVTTGSKNTILGGYNGNQGGLDIRTASNYIVLSDGDGNPRLWVTNGPFLFCPAVYADTAAASANVGVLSTGEIFRTTSSLKYKKNVATTAHGLDDVMKLRAVTYQSNRADENGIVYGGLIAEEVHAAGLTEFVQYAEDGSPDALHYANMVSLAFKAIQELKAEFDAYKEAHP
jgi:hypothetical protein